jgi:hypothetical protein
MDCFVRFRLRNAGTDASARNFETVIASQRIARMRARPVIAGAAKKSILPRKEEWIA